MPLKDSIFKNLFILMLVFVFGYSAQVIIHAVFNKIVEELDEKAKNEQVRYKIGEYILKEINSIESKYYKMATLSNINAALAIKQDILEEIQDVKNAIAVLEKGGSFVNYIKLNIVETSESKEVLEYHPSRKDGYAIESIDLMPKLDELEKKVDSVIGVIGLKKELFGEKDDSLRRKKEIQIELFYKQIPTHFIRMKENASRLLYESKKNMDTIEQEIENKKHDYTIIEAVMTFFILALVLLFGYIVAKQIQKTSLQLKAATDSAKALALEAEQASITKSLFLANMSHEIRTPLNAIIGFSEILSHAELPPKEHNQANIITRSAKSLLAIINDILDISKVESGKFDLTSESFDTRSVLEQSVELFSVKAKEKHIRFIYEASPDLPTTLKGDFVRIQQVLSNLLSNAIKFTGEGGKVYFGVKFLREFDGSVVLRFTIEDSGIGINKEQQKKIFEPFTQADGSISRRYGGTGLGLAITMKIVEKMGSSIRLESEPGRGSKFFFDLELERGEGVDREEALKNREFVFALCSLDNDDEKLRESVKNYLLEIGSVIEYKDGLDGLNPDLFFCFGNSKLLPAITEFKQKYSECPTVYVGEDSKLEEYPDIKKDVDFVLDAPIYGSKIFNIIATACKIEESGIEKEHETDSTLSGRVLVAEDNKNNQMLATILLGNLGLVCEMANDGIEAVELYKNGEFDLVLMDINMPNMDGISATQEIRRLEKEESGKKIPIIALTANTIKGDKEKYLDSGMDDYLPKPIDFKELQKTLAKYLKVVQSTHGGQQKIDKNEVVETNKSDIYDKGVAMEQLGLDEETVDMLLENFFENIADDIEKLQDSILQKNPQDIYANAHYIKGSCANLAMEKPVYILKDIETKAKVGELDSISVDELIKSIDEVKGVI